MPSSSGTILLQIQALDNRIADAATAGYTSMQDGNTSASLNSVESLIKARNQLQALYDRITGQKSLLARGRVVGLPGGCVTTNSSRQ